MARQLLIGLGNPGRKYQRTRHNIGFTILDRMAEVHGLKIKKRKFKARYSEARLFGKDICLIEPQDFMNLSGESVDSFWNYYKVSGSDVLVVHDDIDMALGKLRFVFGSGHGGHNGVRSILDWVYTDEFHRLKIGIGRPPEGADPADYVLRPFDKAEIGTRDEMVEKAVHAIEVFYREGPEKAKTAL